MISQEKLTCAAKCKTLLNILFACFCFLFICNLCLQCMSFSKEKWIFLEDVQGSVASVLGNTSRSHLV